MMARLLTGCPERSQTLSSLISRIFNLIYTAAAKLSQQTVQNSEYGTQNTEYRKLNTEYRIRKLMYTKLLMFMLFIWRGT
jgi:hypothetical protein